MVGTLPSAFHPDDHDGKINTAPDGPTPDRRTGKPIDLKWGILATGGISQSFTKDILISPKTREVQDITHHVVAAASRSKAKAQEFVDTYCKTIDAQQAGVSTQAFGSYEELVACDEVQIVYIGSPHSHHFEHAKLCLNAGKHVLCEKPLTVNAAQAEELVRLAREKKLFFMEAVWTRFFPIMYEIQARIRAGDIGDVTHVHAEFAMNASVDSLADTERLIDPKLAGGSLLDMGPYPLLHVLLAQLHPLLASQGKQDSQEPIPLPKIAASSVFGSKKLADRVGGPIDEATTAILTWPSAHAGEGADEVETVISTSFRREGDPQRVVQIQGTRGTISISSTPCRPTAYKLRSWASPSSMTYGATAEHQEEHTFELPGGIHGFGFEADCCARAIRAGEIEHSRMPHRETILQMKIFDEIRGQTGLTYPESIEAV